MGKTISFTSTPDYLGVLTRSAFADWLRQKTIHIGWLYFIDSILVFDVLFN